MQARSTLTAIALAIAPCSALGFSDFNGDGSPTSCGAIAHRRQCDLAFRQRGHAAADDGGERFRPGRSSGCGDYNGDSRADILWRNSRTGANVIWRSANAATAAGDGRASGLAVVGSGDYNGDGRADILWRNFATGANAIWRSCQFGHGNRRARHRARPGGRGLRRLQRRRQCRHPLAQHGTGANVIWRSAIRPRQQAVTTVTSLSWQVVGSGDYDGDGQRRHPVAQLRQRRECDLAFRKRATPQAMSAITGRDTRIWHIAHSGDYNGDDTFDVSGAAA